MMLRILTKQLGFSTSRNLKIISICSYRPRELTLLQQINMASAATLSTSATGSQKPIPVILCGKSPELGANVTSLIQPELEVIRFFNSYEDAKENIPHLIAGREPATPSSNQVGTHNYAEPPRAVIFGRAFQADQLKELNLSCRGVGSAPVAWIVGDPNIAPPTGPPGPEYAKKAADNVKKALTQWLEAGTGNEDFTFY